MKLTQSVYLDEKVQIFFVLTETCRALDSGTPCDQSCLGTMSFQQQHSFIAPGSFRTHSAPGYRITNRIEPSLFTDADLEKYIEFQDQILAHKLAVGEPAPREDSRYRVRVYIYCPPCACQLATALDICQHSDKKQFLEFCIRIDHRQRTTCSASVTRIEGVISVIDYIKEMERFPSLDYETVDRLKSIDREWLERNIYDYTEEDRLGTLPPADQLARIADFHQNDDSCAAIILLGEADYSVQFAGVPPFRPFEPGRLPRETELFWGRQTYEGYGRWSWEREYMGTYSPKAPMLPRLPPPVRSGQL